MDSIDPHTLYTQNLLNLPHKPSYNNWNALNSVPVNTVSKVTSGYFILQLD